MWAEISGKKGLYRLETTIKIDEKSKKQAEKRLGHKIAFKLNGKKCGVSTTVIKGKELK